jgi:hypothetical protein
MYQFGKVQVYSATTGGVKYISFIDESLISIKATNKRDSHERQFFPFAYKIRRL